MVPKFESLIVLFFTLFCGTAFAQDVGVQADMGVTDAGDRTYLISGVVSLDGRTGGFAADVTLVGDGVDLTIITNNSGAFEFPNVDVGTYTLTAMFPDFEPFVTELDVTQNQFIDIVLYQDLVGTVRVTTSDDAQLTITGPRGTAVDEPVTADTENMFEIPVGEWTLRAESDAGHPFERTFVMTSEADQIYTFDVQFSSTPDPTFDSKTECACGTTPRPIPVGWLLLSFGVALFIRRRL